MYVESAESAVLSRKIREMAKTVTYEATGHCVAYYSIQQRIHNVFVPDISPTAIFANIKICTQRLSRHFHFHRQYGTYTGTIYTLDTNETV